MRCALQLFPLGLISTQLKEKRSYCPWRSLEHTHDAVTGWEEERCGDCSLADTAAHSSQRMKGEHCLFFFIFSFLTWISGSKDVLVILAVLQPISYSNSLGGFFQVSVILSYGTSDILLWQRI